MKIFTVLSVYLFIICLHLSNCAIVVVHCELFYHVTVVTAML